jgi:protein-L-isoaspartate(D-aspartate) O-methyltransferase
VDGTETQGAREALARSLRAVVSDERVLAAMAKVPREGFLAPEMRSLAYEDRPLPIGHGQTTSQPRMIAIMLTELRLQPDDRVLEVGTGSGYQTALLAELTGRVDSVEIVPGLAEGATRALAALGYDAVSVHLTGREIGWPAGAPYDAIVVAAAAPRVPQALADQLAPGGGLVIPVGSSESQDLMLVERDEVGLKVYRKGPCRFVPLLDSEANPESTS